MAGVVKSVEVVEHEWGFEIWTTEMLDNKIVRRWQSGAVVCRPGEKTCGLNLYLGDMGIEKKA
jgi:hypothetical protein